LRLRVGWFTLLLAVSLFILAYAPKLMAGNVTAYIEVTYSDAQSELPKTVGAGIYAYEASGRLIHVGDLQGTTCARGVLDNSSVLVDVAWSWIEAGYRDKNTTLLIVVPWAITGSGEVIVFEPKPIKLVPSALIRGGFLPIRVHLSSDDIFIRGLLSDGEDTLHLNPTTGISNAVSAAGADSALAGEYHTGTSHEPRSDASTAFTMVTLTITQGIQTKGDGSVSKHKVIVLEIPIGGVSGKQ